MRNERSTSKTRSLVWALTVLLTFSLMACGNDKVEFPEGSIIMTTTAKDLRIVLSGSDDIAIHWGDGKKSNLNEGTLLNFNEGLEFSHTYSFAAKRTVYITGKVETLLCDNMQLITLDVSQNPELTALNCSDNLLTELDVSENPALKFLWCYNNQLTVLDTNKNTVLEELRVSDNQIITLDVSRNAALKDLRCSNNLITNIDVSANSGLIVLNLDRNQLTELDVSKNTLLLQMCVEANQLISSELTDLFKAMRYIPEGEYGFIDYTGNPGSDDADHSIWQEKNWLLQSCL